MESESLVETGANVVDKSTPENIKTVSGFQNKETSKSEHDSALVENTLKNAAFDAETDVSRDDGFEKKDAAKDQMTSDGSNNNGLNLTSGQQEKSNGSIVESNALETVASRTTEDHQESVRKTQREDNDTPYVTTVQNSNEKTSDTSVEVSSTTKASVELDNKASVEPSQGQEDGSLTSTTVDDKDKMSQNLIAKISSQDSKLLTQGTVKSDREIDLQSSTKVEIKDDTIDDRTTEVSSIDTKPNIVDNIIDMESQGQNDHTQPSAEVKGDEEISDDATAYKDSPTEAQLLVEAGNQDVNTTQESITQSSTTIDNKEETSEYISANNRNSAESHPLVETGNQDVDTNQDNITQPSTTVDNKEETSEYITANNRSSSEAHPLVEAGNQDVNANQENITQLLTTVDNKEAVSEDASTDNRSSPEAYPLVEAGNRNVGKTQANVKQPPTTLDNKEETDNETTADNISSTEAYFLVEPGNQEVNTTQENITQLSTTVENKDKTDENTTAVNLSSPGAVLVEAGNQEVNTSQENAKEPSTTVDNKEKTDIEITADNVSSTEAYLLVERGNQEVNTTQVNITQPSTTVDNKDKTDEDVTAHNLSSPGALLVEAGNQNVNTSQENGKEPSTTVDNKEKTDIEITADNVSSTEAYPLVERGNQEVNTTQVNITQPSTTADNKEETSEYVTAHNLSSPEAQLLVEAGNQDVNTSHENAKQPSTTVGNREETDKEITAYNVSSTEAYPVVEPGNQEVNTTQENITEPFTKVDNAGNLSSTKAETGNRDVNTAQECGKNLPTTVENKEETAKITTADNVSSKEAHPLVEPENQDVNTTQENVKQAPITLAEARNPDTVNINANQWQKEDGQSFTTVENVDSSTLDNTEITVAENQDAKIQTTGSINTTQELESDTRASTEIKKEGSADITPGNISKETEASSNADDSIQPPEQQETTTDKRAAKTDLSKENVSFDDDKSAAYKVKSLKNEALGNKDETATVENVTPQEVDESNKEVEACTKKESTTAGKNGDAEAVIPNDIPEVQKATDDDEVDKVETPHREADNVREEIGYDEGQGSSNPGDTSENKNSNEGDAETKRNLERREVVETGKVIETSRNVINEEQGNLHSKPTSEKNQVAKGKGQEETENEVSESSQANAGEMSAEADYAESKTDSNETDLPSTGAVPDESLVTETAHIATKTGRLEDGDHETRTKQVTVQEAGIVIDDETPASTDEANNEIISDKYENTSKPNENIQSQGDVAVQTPKDYSETQSERVAAIDENKIMSNSSEDTKPAQSIAVNNLAQDDLSSAEEIVKKGAVAAVEGERVPGVIDANVDTGGVENTEDISESGDSPGDSQDPKEKNIEESVVASGENGEDSSTLKQRDLTDVSDKTTKQEIVSNDLETTGTKDSTGAVGNSLISNETDHVVEEAEATVESIQHSENNVNQSDTQVEVESKIEEGKNVIKHDHEVVELSPSFSNKNKAETINKEDQPNIGATFKGEDVKLQKIEELQDTTGESQESKGEVVQTETVLKAKSEDEDITAQSKRENAESEKSAMVSEETKDQHMMKERRDDVHAHISGKTDETSPASAVCKSEGKDDIVNAPEKSGLGKDEIPDELDEGTREVSSLHPTETPQQSSDGKKPKEKQSMLRNPLSVLGISMGGKSEKKKSKSKSKCDVSQQKKDKDASTKCQETIATAEVSKETEELTTVEKPSETAENATVDDGKEEEYEEYVIVDHQDVHAEERIVSEVPRRDLIPHDDIPRENSDAKEEESPGSEEATEETTSSAVIPERPVVEISSEFLELMEGFCMAAVQEFPSDIIDFAYRYFQQIYKRRNALRKYSIEVSDLALFSDVNWVGNI